MQKFLTVSLLFVLSFQVSVVAQQEVWQAAVEKAESEGFSGVILVAKDGEIYEEKVLGMRRYEDNTPLHKDDLFELASLSKQFAAMMIMIAKEKDLLAFDDLLSDYIEIPYSGITIRHLLTHTSGLPDYQAIMDQYWDKNRVAGNPDILAYLRKYAPPKLFDPGERYEYSNTGYVLLASIVEQVTGRDFVALSKEWIFDPLGMSNTAIRTPTEKAKISAFAAGHLVDSDGNYVNANNFRDSDYTIWLGNRKGPGRVSSNATDLLKWDQALYSEVLVSQETLREAFTPFILNNSVRSYYGFGWELEPGSPFGLKVRHTGDNPGYKTLIVRFIEENRTILILNNNAYVHMKELEDALVSSMAQW